MGPGDAQARRPFPQFSNVTWINPSIGNSTYHGGFIRAEKRFSGSFSFLAHYTFSKFLDDVESSNEYGVTGSYMDAYNRSLDKGLSGSDVPHHLVVTCCTKFRGINRHSFVNAHCLAVGRSACWKHSCPARRLPSSPPPTRRTHFRQDTAPGPVSQSGVAVE